MTQRLQQVESVSLGICSRCGYEFKEGDPFWIDWLANPIMWNAETVRAHMLCERCEP